VRAYVLVKVATGQEARVMEALRGITSVEEIHFLFGEWDYILSLEATDTQTLSRLISARIRRVPGVVQTTTLLEAPA